MKVLPPQPATILRRGATAPGRDSRSSSGEIKCPSHGRASRSQRAAPMPVRRRRRP
jgi:hypothetical protein